MNETPYYPDQFEEACAREDAECASDCTAPTPGDCIRDGRSCLDRRDVAVLFCHAKSIYKTFPAVDCWDRERDAMLWPGGSPCIAHPPCAQWGAMAHLAHIKPAEKVLAMWAVDQVRYWGGVLEHPASSRLWKVMSLPRPGEPADQFGGWTLGIHQHWWGHEADKATHLYIVGCAPADIPPIPMVLGNAPRSMSPHHGRKELLKSKREHTPPTLAEWLVELARRCGSTAQRDSNG